VSLQVDDGEYLTLLGVSGAGKTVLLEVLAGLVKPARGQVLLNGRDITREKIQQRGIGLVYQDLSLFPPPECVCQYSLSFASQGAGTSGSQAAG
jgi:ABC-type sugar transport system ATPase subunit